MTLDIPKRGRGRPKKITVEPDANKIIDIWLKEEPKPTNALAPIRAGAELVLILELVVAVCVVIVYLGVRL